jgi:hypothetical protein
MLALAATASLASCADLALLWGWRVPAWVGVGTLWLLAVGAAVSLWHQRHLAVRLAVGALGGTMGALGASAALMGVTATPWSLGAPTIPLAFAGGALGGMAFATVAGRAHWLWGLAFGLAQGFLLWLLAPAPPSAPAGMAWHLVFGVLLGWLNQRIQPPPPGSVKILFFHDYRPQRSRPEGKTTSRPVR